MFSYLCASLVVPAGAGVTAYAISFDEFITFLHSVQVLQYHFLFGWIVNSLNFLFVSFEQMR